MIQRVERVVSGFPPILYKDGNDNAIVRVHTLIHDVWNEEFCFCLFGDMGTSGFDDVKMRTGLQQLCLF